MIPRLQHYHLLAHHLTAVKMHDKHSKEHLSILKRAPSTLQPNQNNHSETSIGSNAPTPRPHPQGPISLAQPFLGLPRVSLSRWHRISSITSSAPPPMEPRRTSRQMRDTFVSDM